MTDSFDLVLKIILGIALVLAGVAYVLKKLKETQYVFKDAKEEEAFKEADKKNVS
jgi:hypothetical protein